MYLLSTISSITHNEVNIKVSRYSKKKKEKRNNIQYYTYYTFKIRIEENPMSLVIRIFIFDIDRSRVV